MKISLDWLSSLVDVSSLGKTKPEIAQKLSDLLTRRGIEVEAIHTQGQGFEKVVSAKILEKKPHPDATRLSLCQVTTDGSAAIEIVCGAQNMKAGDIVALAQVGAELPNGLKIAQSKIRGVVSNGMLCSEEELKLKDFSEGILILPESTKLGKPLAEILNLTDIVLELKLTANRADCLSHFGLAREVAAGLGSSVSSLKPLEFDKTLSLKDKFPVEIKLGAGDHAPQFWGAVMEGVKISESPSWVKTRLESLGSRSINTVVDATNLVMFELGHPVHAYDFEKLADATIGVRVGKKGESLPLLDGTSVTLDGFELVIESGKSGKAVGLAGVMGGGNSEVSDSTTKLFLECAEFSPSLIRKSSTKHQKKTEASHRFERGIDPAALEIVTRRLIWWIQTLSGGKLKSVFGISKTVSSPKISAAKDYFKNFLGMPIQESQVQSTLENLGCKVEKSALGWTVTPPSFRRDLNLKEDLAEEVARSLGYDLIPETLPIVTTFPGISESSKATSDRLELLERTKDSLRGMGLSESLNFGFTSLTWLEKLGLTSSLKLLNPISEEHEYLNPSLLPGLLKNCVDNENKHFGSEPLSVKLFELRTTFEPSPTQKETGVTEPWRLACVLSGPRFVEGLRVDQGKLDFFDLKGVVLGFLKSLGVKGARIQPLDLNLAGSSRLKNVSHLFHPAQTAQVVVGGKEIVGLFGKFHPLYSQKLKLKETPFIAEFDWEKLFTFSRKVSSPETFKTYSDFPGMERDFALLVKDGIAAEHLTQTAIKAAKPLAKIAKVFDVYRGDQVLQGMTSVAVRVIFYDETRSLLETEVEQASAQILALWKKELGVELRGG